MSETQNDKYLDSSPTEGKKQSVERTQSNTIRAISEIDREMIKHKRIQALGILQERLTKRTECEGQAVIEREKDRLKESKQRVVSTRRKKKQRMMSEARKRENKRSCTTVSSENNKFVSPQEGIHMFSFTI